MIRKIAVIAFVLALTFTLTGVEAMAQGPIEISVAQGADAVTLDPHGENDQPSSRVRSQIYETLINQDEKLNLEPGLAVSWDQIDETTWEFELRQGVTFHNGEEFTAEDVKFTLERLKDPETAAAGAFIVSFLEEVEVIDEYRVRLKTDKPFAPMLNHLAHPVTGMLNKEAVEEAGEDYGTLTVTGTGPFKFKSWSTGSEIELVKYEDYWGENAKADTVIFRNIPENTVRAIEVETGGVDIAYNIAPIDEERLVEAPEINLIKHDTLSTSYIGFNCQVEPYDNVKVRKAINYAINKEEIVKYVYTGQATRSSGPISDNVWGAHTDLDPYYYNQEKAKELLEEAGYSDGFSTTIYTNDNPLRMQIAEMVQSDLKKVGIDVEIQVLEWGTYLERTGGGDHEMFILGWVAVTGDADYGLYALFHSSQYGHAGNRTFWSDKRVDAYLDTGRQHSDPEIRMEAYEKSQEIIRDKAPWVFLIHTQEANATRENVEGFVPHPAGHHDLSNVTKTQ